jgi:cation-transporting ATPase 13A2
LIVGRASLDLTYELFRYLIVYCYLQFVSVIILYSKTVSFDDRQIVFFDLGGVVPITILLCWTEANTKLVNLRPVRSLFSLSIYASIFGQIVIQCSFILGMYFCLRGQNFYEETRNSDEFTSDGDESTTLFYITIPQYVFMGIAFHTATQFRKPLYTNIPFLLLLCVQLAMIGWLILGPLHWMEDVLNLSKLDFYFRVIIVGAALVNGMMTIMYEQIVQRTLGKADMESKIEFSGKGRGRYAVKTASFYIPSLRSEVGNDEQLENNDVE